MKLIVSACLAGLSCRYDGRACLSEQVRKFVDKGLAVPACPELLGGLNVPRLRAEIVGGNGADVLDCKARVIDETGKDITSIYLSGAEKMQKIALDFGAAKSVLKDKSPSCGINTICDGTFTASLIQGNGVAAALLQRKGIEPADESDLISNVQCLTSGRRQDPKAVE